MSRVIFLNQPSVGHVTTLLNIATQMKEDGHQVSFIVPGMRLPRTYLQVIDTALAIPAMIRANDIPVEVIRPPLAVFWEGIFLPTKTGYEEILAATHFLSVGVEHYARRIVKMIEEDPPDTIVTDFAFLGASLAAEILKIPCVAIYHSGLPFRGDLVPPFGSGLPIGADSETAKPYTQKENEVLELLDRRINTIREKLGLPPTARDILRHPYSPWLNLITSVSEAEVPRNNLTPSTLFIGPCFGKRKRQAEFPFSSLVSDKYKIYVSLGTVFNNRPEFFRKIMRALDVADYQVIISAGGAFRTLQRGAIPLNALLFQSVPQAELLPQVDLFISHGGNNSINEALAAGKPIIVAPVGGEQGDNASRVTYLGVGRRLDIAHFDEAQLRDAVEEIRGNAAFQERAMRMMQAVKATEGVATASRCIGWVAQHRSPLNRPEGCSVTITRQQWGELLR